MTTATTTTLDSYFDARLNDIRASWWLDEPVRGLVVQGESVVGVLTREIDGDRDYWRLPAREPLSWWSTGSIDERSYDVMLTTVTLRRLRRSGNVWEVVDGHDALALVDAVVPVVGPLPATWAVLAVAAAYRAAAVRALARRLLTLV